MESQRNRDLEVNKDDNFTINHSELKSQWVPNQIFLDSVMAEEAEAKMRQDTAQLKQMKRVAKKPPLGQIRRK